MLPKNNRWNSLKRNSPCKTIELVNEKLSGDDWVAYLKRYIRCFLKAQHSSVGSDKGSLLSLTLAATEGIFLTFLLPLSPWYRAIFRNLSLFSTFPRMRETLFVCKFTIWITCMMWLIGFIEKFKNIMMHIKDLRTLWCIYAISKGKEWPIFHLCNVTQQRKHGRAPAGHRRNEDTEWIIFICLDLRSIWLRSQWQDLLVKPSISPCKMQTHKNKKILWHLSLKESLNLWQKLWSSWM